MPNESMMRIFHIDDGENVASYPIRDSHINVAYGECSTVAATAAKTVTLTNDPGWKLAAGSFVIVKFTYAVPANATLAVGSTMAQNIYIKNAAIGANVIVAGDIVTFMYDGAKYVVTAIDRVMADINDKAEKNSPALTGTPTAPTATAGTNTTQIATTEFVMESFRANDAMIFKGTIGTGGKVTSLPAVHDAGWTYKVITAGTYAGKVCEVGDSIICIADGTTANDGDWHVMQANIDGAVTGPASSTADHVATFDGTSGKLIKDSGFTIGKSVPSDAQFTDTNTWRPVSDSVSSTSTTDAASSKAAKTAYDEAVKVMTGASDSAAGAAGRVPAPAAGDEEKVLHGDGTWKTPSGSIDMTGATSSAAGSHGLAPAPAAGDQNKVLTGAGTWEVSPGAKKHPVTLTITNTSGAYDHTFTTNDVAALDVVTADMIVDRIEIGDPNVFDAGLNFVCGNGSIRVRCNNVSGTSTLVCWVQKVISDPTTVTSTEFDILNNRLAAVENVEINYAITIPTSGWTLSNGIYKYTWSNSTITGDTSVDFNFLDESADTDDIGIEKITGGIEFTADWVPEAAIPVKIKVTYARNSDVEDLTGDMVSTSTVSGASNVDEALTALNSKITIRQKEITGTTDADGFLRIDGELQTGQIAIAVVKGQGECYLCSASATYNNQYVKSSRKSQEITITIKYIG